MLLISKTQRIKQAVNKRIMAAAMSLDTLIFKTVAAALNEMAPVAPASGPYS